MTLRTSAIFFTTFAFLLGCAKRHIVSGQPVETVVQGHLRYACSCLDGPGLYFVTEPSDIIQPAALPSAADSIVLIGDGKGRWLIDDTTRLGMYINVKTALHGIITGKKGCLQGQIASQPCKGEYNIVDTIAFTILP